MLKAKNDNAHVKKRKKIKEEFSPNENYSIDETAPLKC